MLLDPSGKIAGTGYSGFGVDKDKPSAESIPGEGPIPRGVWTIGPSETHPKLGPVVMPLTPTPTTIWGWIKARWTRIRTGFFIHGDSAEHPGQASHGCIVLPYTVRVLLAASVDRQLVVLT